MAQGGGDAIWQATEPATSSRSMMDHWQPSTRYSDQPTSLKTRLAGMGGIVAIALLITGGALLTWTTYQAVQKPATLSVFDVAPPAAPPEPARDIPPGPEEVEKDQDMPDIVLPQIQPPEIRLPSINALPLPDAKPIPDPEPPARDTTAPETPPAPPAQQVSSGEPTWEGLVLGALNKVKRYPREASFRRQQGVPYIRFVMNRNGEVLSVRLERSSGVRALDNEALALPRRAAPLPKPPKEVAGDTVELVVPVEFFMR
ncbi:MAG: energy transducer TonB [Sphingomonadales bacterium 32-64-17]|nr:MAG: energy transducer TonB [Sphingomonadales bacterium 32-64-17]